MRLIRPTLSSAALSTNIAAMVIGAGLENTVSSSPTLGSRSANGRLPATTMATKALIAVWSVGILSARKLAIAATRKTMTKTISQVMANAPRTRSLRFGFLAQPHRARSPSSKTRTCS